jgi:type II secretory pathway pseudopilin PulG
MIKRSTRANRDAAPTEAGYSLVELLVAMGITTVIMGATLAGLSDAIRSNEAVLQMTTMNNGLRAAMDLMVRDLLQTGSGLPKGHVILTPSGGALIRRPGPPGTAYTSSAADLSIPAVIPGAGLGPVINGMATDMITILTADNNFTDVALTAVTSTSVDVSPAVDIGAGIDRVIAGQLMMVYKGSTTTLVQVTAVDPVSRRISFGTGDSLRLNQTGGGIVGNLASLNAQPPTGAAAPAATRLTRVRMISYYLDDTTSPGRPRLVRRVNNGHAIDFDNTLGTAVAFDVENLRFTYDINDGAANPSGVRFVPEDLTALGACAPDECSPTQIRKVNVTLTARSQNATNPQARVYRNTLQSQVALRGMALVNEYQ